MAYPQEPEGTPIPGMIFIVVSTFQTISEMMKPKPFGGMLFNWSGGTPTFAPNCMASSGGISSPVGASFSNFKDTAPLNA